MVLDVGWRYRIRDFSIAERKVASCENLVFPKRNNKTVKTNQNSKKESPTKQRIIWLKNKEIIGRRKSE